MNDIVKNYYDLAFDYHIAAATLHTQLIDATYLFYPVAFLIRHTIELLLKGIIIQKELLTNSNQQISKIRIGNNGTYLDRTHSLLNLWQHCKLIDAIFSVIGDKDQMRVSDLLEKLNEIDFSSTKYRYPVDRENNLQNIEPLKIDDSGVAPEIGDEPPVIAIRNNKVVTITKSDDLLAFNADLFDVIEILFSLLEEN